MDLNHWGMIGIILSLIIGTALGIYHLIKLNKKLKKLTQEITQTTIELKRAR